MVKPQIVNPPRLGPALGYSNGVQSRGLLFLAGQIGGEPKPTGRHRIVPGGLVPQFEKALENVLEVVRAAGASAQDIVEMTVYVTDMDAYRGARKPLGEAWKRRMGKHYPAMTLAGVASLFEPDAVVEIRAIAQASRGKK